MRNRFIQLLATIEKRSRETRRKLERRRTQPKTTDRPNDAAEWDRIYSSPVAPVTVLKSEIAVLLESLSQPGDVLLETGCGTASISAELATAGRRIELADFSQAILDRAARLFAASNLPVPVRRLADLTQPLPWPNRSVDITWSSGVLEHWTDEELDPIVREMVRISRRRVISLVPYAGSAFYRWGKWVAEQEGTWSYGRELPRQTLRPLFERAGLSRVTERTIWGEASLNFLQAIDPDLLPAARKWWQALPKDDPLRDSQGYLLVTVGEVADLP